MESNSLSKVLHKTRSTRILVVDDEDLVRGVFLRALERWGYQVDGAADAETAFSMVKGFSYDLILSDVRMPEKDGVWLLSQVETLENPPMMMMATAHAELDVAIHCLTHGAYDLLLKPVELGYLKSKVESAVQHMHLLEDRKRHQELLEEVAIAERWRSQQMFLSAMDALNRALEAKDVYTEGHSARVAVISEGIATHLNLSTGQINDVITAARIHDIGKIGVEDSVLLKPGKLTDEEFEEIKRHSTIGARILSPIFKDRTEIVAMVKHHHERFLGGGYPDGISGEQIPFLARIITVADSYDAMTSTRVYRQARSSKEAVNEIIKWTGKQFCPTAVKGFLRFYRHAISTELKQDAWQDQRRNERYECDSNLNLLYKGEEEFVAALDVSNSGIRLLTSMDLPIDSEIRIELERMEQLEARIKWSTETTQNGEPQRMVGGEILNPHDAFLEFVQQASLREAERRLSPRVYQFIPVEITHDEEKAQLNILNLGLDGAFIQTRTPLMQGEKFFFRFTLPDPEEHVIEGRGVVMHQLSLEDALKIERAIPGMGVRFFEMEQSVLKTLERFVLDQAASRRWSAAGNVNFPIAEPEAQSE